MYPQEEEIGTWVALSSENKREIYTYKMPLFWKEITKT